MLPQQKNPAGVSQSMHQQTTSNNNLEEPDKRPFSIRQYVLACRQKDVLSNWPFPEKYLQICLNYGISDVLPPLESHNSAIQSLRGAVGLNCTQQDDENVDYSKDKEPDTIEQEIEDELCCVSSAPLEQGSEGIENMIDVRHDCNSDLTKDFSSEKLERDDSEEAKLSMPSRQKIVVKFKFSSCKSDV
ncbi:hypothetical protein GBA52_008621 [Prunus armeniaca]|nr:hypothetical protein GBA52_008621 [Prunus armeniaca]